MTLTEFMPDITSDYRSFLEAALIMAGAAGEIHMKYFRSPDIPQTTKLNDSDVVTVADKEAEAAIIGYIHRHYPGHGIISEESGSEHPDCEWRWVIDPLDGTTNFSAGLPVFSVSIALEHRGEAVAGVVFAPYLRECFYAVRGHGAWLNGRLLRCSSKTALSKAVLTTGMPYDRTVNPDNNLSEIARMALRVRAVRVLGSAAIDLCYAAAGFTDGYWELNLNRWDVAAGQLIASEAGAVVESIRSQRNHSLVVANQGLIASVRSVLLTDDYSENM